MSTEQPDPSKNVPEAAPETEQTYPAWVLIKARITPGMLGLQPAQDARGWAEIADDEDESQPK